MCVFRVVYVLYHWLKYLSWTHFCLVCVTPKAHNNVRVSQIIEWLTTNKNFNVPCVCVCGTWVFVCLWQHKRDEVIIFVFFFYFILGNKEQCRTPDSPEGARVVTPRSPQQQRTSRNGCSSPVRNGSSGSITPPPPATPISLTTTTTTNNGSVSSDASRLLKIRRFLGALVQFGQDTNADIGDRVRSLVLSLAVSTHVATFIDIYLCLYIVSIHRVVDWQLKTFK